MEYKGKCGNCSYCLTGQKVKIPHLPYRRIDLDGVVLVLRAVPAGESPRLLARFALGRPTLRICALSLHLHKDFACLRGCKFEVRQRRRGLPCGTRSVAHSTDTLLLGSAECLHGSTRNTRGRAWRTLETNWWPPSRVVGGGEAWHGGERERPVEWPELRASGCSWGQGDWGLTACRCLEHVSSHRQPEAALSPSSLPEATGPALQRLLDET